MLGELLAGVILGPSLLNILQPSMTVSVLAQLGIVILLLEVGLETRLKDFKGLGLSSLLVALIGVAVPFVFGYLFAHYLKVPGGAKTAIFLGATLTATSIGITARTFADMKKLRTKEARIVLGAAVLDDVIGLVILSVVLGLVKTGSLSLFGALESATLALVFIAGILFLGNLLVPPFLRFLNEKARVRGSLFAGALALCFLAAFVAEKIGLSPIIGAFTIGIVLTKSEFHQEITRKVASYAEILVGIFFISVGMVVDLRSLLEPRILILALGITALAVVGKLFSGFGVIGKAKRAVVAVGMIPRGEVGLIFASFGLTYKIFSQSIYSAILLMVLVTTIITPPLLKAVFKRGGELSLVTEP